MPANGELRRISWSQTFPFVRLFRTFQYAGLHFGRLILGLACVLGWYFTGRILDWVWPASQSVMVRNEGGQLRGEIDAYATLPKESLENWIRRTELANRQLAEKALQDALLAQSAEEASQKLARNSAVDLLTTEQHEKDVGAAFELIEARVRSGLAAIANSGELSEELKVKRRDELREAADALRLALGGIEPPALLPRVQRSSPAGVIAGADPQIDPQQQIKDQDFLQKTVARCLMLKELRDVRPRGPFISLWRFESRCFAAAIQGVCHGRFGFAGTAFDPQPPMLGSVVTALRGGMWLVTQRPWFALVCGLVHLVIAAFFAGAICRSAAVQSARDENISFSTALAFARQKLGQLVLAPLTPLAFAAFLIVLLWIGGIIGLIPVIGEFLDGLFFILALLGGFALTLTILGLVLGFHLLWPTIAVEGSDAFDALSHGIGYIAQRIWHVGFYGIVLLIYGGISFVMVRLIAMLTLKFTHVCVGAGMSFFGTVGSARMDGITKLDAMWRMPAFGDLRLIPSPEGVPFFGTFHNAPLSGSEWVGMVLLMCWVFLVVSLVLAFVVNFYLCGSVEMYFLLRREVDASDYAEIYYEEPESVFPSGEPEPGSEIDARTEAGSGAAPTDAHAPPDEEPREDPGGGAVR